jgi:hypothetical protein
MKQVDKTQHEVKAAADAQPLLAACSYETQARLCCAMQASSQNKISSHQWRFALKQWAVNMDHEVLRSIGADVQDVLKVLDTLGMVKCKIFTFVSKQKRRRVNDGQGRKGKPPKRLLNDSLKIPVIHTCTQ